MSKLIRLHHFGGKEVLRTEELNVSQPDAGEVLVSVRAASVNPVDFKIRSGKYPSVRDDGVVNLEYSTKEAAFESLAAAASMAIREGHEVQINVPGG